MLAKEFKGAFQTDKDFDFDLVAEAYPLWAAGDQGRQELESLSNSIAEHGQRLPIVLCSRDDKEMIADGRRRFQAITKGKACKEAGIKPWYIREEDEEGLPDLARDLNEHRRNLSSAQLMASVERMLIAERELAAARAKKAKQEAKEAGTPEEPSADAQANGEAPPEQGAEQEDKSGKSAEKIARRLGVGTSTVERIAAIHADGCDALQDAVRDDTLSVGAAYQISKLPHDLQKEAIHLVKKEKMKPGEAIRKVSRTLKVVKDQMGRKVPGSMKVTFLHVEDVRKARHAIQTAKSFLEDSAKGRTTATLPTQLAQSAIKMLDSIKTDIEQGEAFTYCRGCDGKGCGKCKDRGWISREMFSKLSKEAKQEIEKGE